MFQQKLALYPFANEIWLWKFRSCDILHEFRAIYMSIIGTIALFYVSFFTNITLPERSRNKSNEFGSDRR